VVVDAQDKTSAFNTRHIAACHLLSGPEVND